MPNFKSRPHEIEAFQFLSDVKITPPKWFNEAYHRDEIQVTMSDRYGYYITVYSKDQSGKVVQMEKAFLNWWICRASHGKIYVLDDKSFRKSYETL